MKIRLVRAYFYADGQTDRQDEANSRFPQFCERSSKAEVGLDGASPQYLSILQC